MSTNETEKMWHVTRLTLHNVCAVHQGVCSTLGDFSTLGDITKYTGRISWVHWVVFSTVGDIMSTLEEYHEYTGSCSVQWGGGGISCIYKGIPWWVWRDIMRIPGDTMMSVERYHEYSRGIQYTRGYHEYSGGYHDECGGYHEYTRGCSVHWGFHTNSIVFPMTFSHIYHDIPSPSVLMISSSLLNTPSVLLIYPLCTHETP